MYYSSGCMANSSSRGISRKYSNVASGCYDCRNAGDKTWIGGNGVETREANSRSRHHRGRVGVVRDIVGLIVVVILAPPG